MDNGSEDKRMVGEDAGASAMTPATGMRRHRGAKEKESLFPTILLRLTMDRRLAGTTEQRARGNQDIRQGKRLTWPSAVTWGTQKSLGWPGARAP